jgi:hypothetical protein
MQHDEVHPEHSQWRKWVALAYRRSRSTSYGHNGRRVDR